MYSNRSLLSCGAAALVLCVASQASAQTRTFNIPPQPAVRAIPEFARQARVQVIAPARDLEGVRSQGVSGEFDVNTALSRLIAGTPLWVAMNEGGVITLRTQRSADAPGVLTGRVLDPASGQYMPNATVRIRDASGEHRTIVTGERGEFRLSGLPAGETEATVSFTGYADRTASVVIRSGEVARLELAVFRAGETEATTLAEVVVTASSRDGDARAIMSQRQSMDIKNSLSSESFGSIDEGNVGEFIRYMPGVDAEGEGDDTVRYIRLRGLPPEYASITVNGVSMAAADANAGSTESRAFSFEQVSLSSVDSIEISKTVSADVDANAPAGTINLRTKRAFDRRGRRISGSVSANTHSDMWNNRIVGPGEGEHDARLMPSGQIEYSDVFFNRRLGVVASVSQSNTYTEMEQAYYPRSYAPTTASPDPMAMTSIWVGMRAQEVSRFAGSLTLDWRATDRLILSLSSIYNDAYLWSGQRAYSFTTGARTYGVVGDAGLDFTTRKPANAAGISAGSNIIAKRGEGSTFVPSFEYTGDDFVIDGNLSYSDSSSTYDPLGEGAVYSYVTSPASTGNFHASRPDMESTRFTIEQVSGPDWANPASFAGTTLRFNAEDGRYARTELSSGALNLSRDFTTPAGAITLKAGLKAKRSIYDFGNERAAHQYRYVGPMSTVEFLTQTASANVLNFNEMGVGYTSLSGSNALYMPSNYKIGALFSSNPEQFEHVLTAADYYTAYIANVRHFEEDSNAAYLMATSKVNDRLNVRAGLRWEETRTRSREFDPLGADEVRAAGYAVSTSTGRATTIDGLKYQFESQPRVEREGKYDHLFPSASMKYAISDSIDLQLGYSRTIRRPQVNVLAGVWSVDDELMIVTAPNPGLEPEISDNLSVRLAKYFEPVGLVAVNYYRNEVKGLFQTEDLTAEEFGYTGSEYQGYTFRTTTRVSGDAISIEGYEFEFNHSLTYLPGLWNGLTVRGSFTHTVPETPIAGSAENFASLSLAYQQGPVRLNLNTAWTGDKLNSVSTGSWIEARTAMNLSGSYALRRGLSAFFSVRNLLNEPTRIMLPGVETPNGPVPVHAGDYREYGASGSLGLRFVF